MTIEPASMDRLINSEYYLINGKRDAIIGCGHCGCYYGEYNEELPGCASECNCSYDEFDSSYLYAYRGLYRYPELVMFNVSPFQYLTGKDPTPGDDVY